MFLLNNSNTSLICKHLEANHNQKIWKNSENNKIKYFLYIVMKFHVFNVSFYERTKKYYFQQRLAHSLLVCMFFCLLN